eukprot:scaffold1982_cov93-Amphora_coffeaeformis.AAC.47
MTSTFAYNDPPNKGTAVAVPIGEAPAYNNNNQNQNYNTNVNSVPRTTSGKATASLICGIIGILIFGIILGPIAICLGVSARQDIRNSNGQIEGEGQANADFSVQSDIQTQALTVLKWRKNK